MSHALNGETNFSEVKVATEQLFADHFYNFGSRAPKFPKNSLIVVSKASIVTRVWTPMITSKSRWSEINGLF